MTRVLTGVLLLALAGMKATCQLNPPTAPAQTTESPQSTAASSGQGEMWQRIARLEAAARNSEAAGADRHSLAMIYANLGNLYENLAMTLKAEDALKRAIALLKSGPQEELASAIGELAVLHLEMGKMREAEREELQALQIREAIGDPLGIAVAEKELAGFYAAERNFKRSVGYAESAYEVLADNADVKLPDRIAIRYALGFALTGVRNCDRGIQLLKGALELTRNSPGLDRLHLGYTEYLLGFGYWQCGDRDDAARWLGRGTADMKSDFGWDHAIYIGAMSQYARFLRKIGENEAAVSAETVVRQAEAVVDARTLTGRAQGFQPSGSK